ncbi:MAG: hypothetical protein KF864_08140 [Phycisphaeraceae bacterium]|nr:hypothetical protein [Phycisphaeraceae bacterium]
MPDTDRPETPDPGSPTGDLSSTAPQADTKAPAGGYFSSFLAWLFGKKDDRTKLIIAFLMWLLIFGVGLTIPSKPWRDVIVASCFKNLEQPAAPVICQRNIQQVASAPLNAVATGHRPEEVGQTAHSETQSGGHNHHLAGCKNCAECYTAMCAMLAPLTSGCVSNGVAGCRLENDEYAQAATAFLTKFMQARQQTQSKNGSPMILPFWQLIVCFPFYLAVIILSFTPTNLLMLCVFGSVLGTYGIRLLRPNVTAVAHLRSGTAVLHGLCVYLGIAAGLIVVQGELQFDVAEPTLYLRLSATATLLSVAAGANPYFLRNVASLFRINPTEGATRATV